MVKVKYIGVNDYLNLIENITPNTINNVLYGLIRIHNMDKTIYVSNKLIGYDITLIFCLNSINSCDYEITYTDSYKSDGIEGFIAFNNKKEFCKWKLTHGN